MITWDDPSDFHGRNGGAGGVAIIMYKQLENIIFSILMYADSNASLKWNADKLIKAHNMCMNQFNQLNVKITLQFDYAGCILQRVKIMTSAHISPENGLKGYDTILVQIFFSST